MKYLSHNIYALTDKEAAKLWKDTPRGKAPKIGYELFVIFPNGQKGWLRRWNLISSDSIKNKRGWVWGVSLR